MSHVQRAEPVARANALTGPSVSRDARPLDTAFSLEKDGLCADARGSSLTLGKEMAASPKSHRGIALFICFVAIMLAVIFGYFAYEEVRTEEVHIFYRSGDSRVVKKATDPDAYWSAVIFSVGTVCFVAFIAISQVRGIFGRDEKRA